MERLNEQVVQLTAYFGQQWHGAMQMRLSDLNSFFSSKSYSGWIKSREHEMKLAVATIDRVNGVIDAIGNLGKSLARSRTT